MPKQQDAMLVEVRQQSIVDIIRLEGNTTVAELCKRFNVSPATIRNDLTKLEATNQLKRTHGGAISGNRVNYELTADEKEVQNVREKHAIAEAALRFIQPGDVVAIDTGTTTFELARRIVNISNLTVMTNDLQIALYLEANSDCGVIVIGGALRRNYHCSLGAFSVQMIDSLHVDTAFIAANGVTAERGLSTPNMEMAGFKRKLIEISEQTYLLADSSKIGKSSFAHIAPLSAVDALITDDSAPGDFIQQAESSGIRVIAAQPVPQKIISAAGR